MEVIPTPALAIQLALPFLVALVGLTFILFKPLLAYLREREGAVTTAKHEASHLHHEIEERVSALEKRLAAAREEAAGVRSAARARAKEREAGILTAARQQADAKVDAATATIAAERQGAAASMKTMAHTLSSEIASAILGRPVGGT